MKLNPQILLDWENPNPREEHIWKVMNGYGFIYMGHGKERMTFLSPKRRVVLKFGLDVYGHLSNMKEAAAWKRYKRGFIEDDIVLAPCRMYRGCALMMWAMVKLYGDTPGCDEGRRVLGQRPEFRDVQYFDSSQVGIMRNGKPAAYDYADEF